MITRRNNSSKLIDRKSRRRLLLLLSLLGVMGLIPLSISGRATGSGGGCGAETDVEQTSSRLTLGAGPSVLCTAGTADCNGTCWPTGGSAHIGDGKCDAGIVRENWNCEAHGWDGGDCSALRVPAQGHARLWLGGKGLGSEGLDYFKKSYALTKSEITNANCYSDVRTPDISANNEWVHACAWKTAQETADENIDNYGNNLLNYLQNTSDVRNIEKAFMRLMVTYHAKNFDSSAAGRHSVDEYRDSAIAWVETLAATPTCVYSALNPFAEGAKNEDDEAAPKYDFQIYSVYTYSETTVPSSTYIYRSSAGIYYAGKDVHVLDESGNALNAEKLTPARQKSVWSRCSSILLTLAVAYDWLYDDLDDEQRKTLRNRILAEVLAFDKEYLFDLTNPSWVSGQATSECTGANEASCDKTIKCCRDFEGYSDKNHWSNCHKYNAMFTETCPVSCTTAACINTCSLTKAGRERLSQNSNMVQSAALGTAALVIHDGIMADVAAGDADPDSVTNLKTALKHADLMAQTLLNKVAQDGANTEGMGYWSYGLGALLRYLDARRTMLGDISGFDSAWLANSENFYQRMRHPNGHLANLDDSIYWGGNASGIFGLLAKISQSSSKQRLAWQGSGPWNNPALQRPVWALLWYDLSLVAATNTAVLPTLSKFHHFEERGLLSFRSDWQDESAMHLLVQGGTPIGGHQHPAAGHFVLFGKKQHLVTGQGRTSVSHTAAHNTLLIDGYGQHGNGADMAQPPPKEDAAEAKVLTFQNGGHDSAITTLDLTGMYSYEVDKYDDDWAEEWKGYTSGFDAYTDTSVTEVLRSFVWLGGDAILIHDTVTASEPVDVHWKLHNRAFQSGFTDSTKRHSNPSGTTEMEYYDCNVAVDEKTNLYKYEDSLGATYGLKLSSTKIKTNASSVESEIIESEITESEITESTVYQQFSTGSLKPVVDPDCDKDANQILLNTDDSSEATITVDNATLSVTAYDGNAMEVLASPSGSGSTIRGYHLSRSKKESATAEFTTWLLPSTEGAGATAKVSQVEPTNGVGDVFTIDFVDGREALVLAGKSGSELSTSSASLTGHIGLVEKNSRGDVTSVQLAHGTKLTSSGIVYLSSNAGVSFSASLDYAPTQLTGTVTVSKPTEIQIYVGLVRPRSVRLSGVSTLFSRVGVKMISLTVNKSGKLNIR